MNNIVKIIISVVLIVVGAYIAVTGYSIIGAAMFLFGMLIAMTSSMK